jgi:hypothetical protein
MSFESQIDNMRKLREAFNSRKTPAAIIHAIDQYAQHNGLGELIDPDLQSLRDWLNQLGPKEPLRTRHGNLVPELEKARARLVNGIIKGKSYLQSVGMVA